MLKTEACINLPNVYSKQSNRLDPATAKTNTATLASKHTDTVNHLPVLFQRIPLWQRRQHHDLRTARTVLLNHTREGLFLQS